MIVHGLKCKLHILGVENRPEENLKLTSESVKATLFRSTFEVSRTHFAFQRLVFSGQESDKLFKLFSEKVRSLAPFAFDVICRLIEEVDIVSPNLT